MCIPPRALHDLEPDDLDPLLGHELAHVARRDPAWLVVELARLRSEPAQRAGGEALADDVETLATCTEQLRARAAGVSARLAAHTNIPSLPSKPAERPRNKEHEITPAAPPAGRACGGGSLGSTL